MWTQVAILNRFSSGFSALISEAGGFVGTRTGSGKWFPTAWPPLLDNVQSAKNSYICMDSFWNMHFWRRRFEMLHACLILKKMQQYNCMNCSKKCSTKLESNCTDALAITAKLVETVRWFVSRKIVWLPNCHSNLPILTGIYPVAQSSRNVCSSSLNGICVSFYLFGDGKTGQNKNLLWNRTLLALFSARTEHQKSNSSGVSAN